MNIVTSVYDNPLTEKQTIESHLPKSANLDEVKPTVHKGIKFHGWAITDSTMRTIVDIAPGLRYIRFYGPVEDIPHWVRELALDVERKMNETVTIQAYA